MTAAVVCALLLYAAVVAAVEVVGVVQTMREDRRVWDSTEADVAELPTVLRDAAHDPDTLADRTRVLREPTAEYPTLGHVYGVPSRRPAPMAINWARWQTPPGGMPVLTGQGVISA